MGYIDDVKWYGGGTKKEAEYLQKREMYDYSGTELHCLGTLEKMLEINMLTYGYEYFK